MARNATLSAAAAHGRRSADAVDHSPGSKVRAVRVPAHHRVVAECGLGGRQGSSAADLATRRAESTAETAGARALGAFAFPPGTTPGGTPFRMVFIRTRDQDVVADDFPFRSRTAESFQTPPTRTFLRILTRSAYCLDRAMVPPSIGEDITVGSRFGQTDEEWTPERTPRQVSD